MSYRRLLKPAQRGDVTIFIDRRIELSRMLTFPESRSTVRLIGVGEQAALHLNRSFRGSAERIFRSRSQTESSFGVASAMSRIWKFFGFEMQGSAIKAYTDELLSVVNCHFHDIGMKEFPYRGGKARSAEDSVYTQCGRRPYQLRRCRIEIIRCKFVRCCANTWQWSHCLYLSARSVLVANCAFSDCGNPFGIGEREVPGEILIIGDRVESPAPPGTRTVACCRRFSAALSQPTPSSSRETPFRATGFVAGPAAPIQRKTSSTSTTTAA